MSTQFNNITAADALTTVTQSAVEGFKFADRPKSFLRSMFATKTYGTKLITMEVMRLKRAIAVDIMPGQDSNLNRWDKSTVRQYDPPMYAEKFDVQELDGYDRAFATNGFMDQGVMMDLSEKTADKLEYMTDKIERAKNLQCAQALQTGIVTVNNGDNIDFKRKGSSKITADPVWSNASGDPDADLLSAINFIRKNGQTGVAIYDAVMSESSLSDFKSNADVQKKLNIRNTPLSELKLPEWLSDLGASYHGEYAVGNYIVRIWGYPETYLNSAGTETPYITDHQVIVMPFEGKGLEMRHAGVPGLSQNGIEMYGVKAYTMQQAEYYVRAFSDDTARATYVEVSSRPVAIPVAVDRIATITTGS